MRADEIVEGAPDAIVIADAHGRIELVNAQTERLFGYPREALLGQSVETLLPESLRGAHERHREGYVARPRVRAMGEGRELHGRRSDGSEFPIEISLSPLDGGARVMAAIRDITDRKREEVRFRGLLDSAPDAMVIVDSAGRIVLANSQTERLFGHARDELVGKPVEVLMPERYRGRHWAHRAGYVRDPHVRGMGEGLELFGLRRDGAEVPVEISLSPLQTPDGTLVSCAIRDITERVRIQRALQDSEARARLLVEGVADYGIYWLDPGGNVASWNAGAERLFGYTTEQALGQSHATFFPPEERAAGAPDAALLAAAHVGHHESEGLRVRRDGSTFWASIHLTALHERNGALVGFSKIVRDLTERRRFELELERQAGELRRSNGDLERLAYVASHDLQEPLRIVGSYAQLLERRYKGKLDADADEFIGYITGGVTRMHALINDLLRYSRVGSAGVVAPARLDDCLDDALANLAVTLRESGARVERDPLPTIAGRRTELTQLFQNLVGNAVKFRGEAPPVVRISTRRVGAAWEIRVEDNGIGIAPQFHERVFVLFQRLHGAGKYEGTGIGLALVKKIVEQHGGSIRVESEEGKGAAFVFTLPVASGAAITRDALGRALQRGALALSLSRVRDGRFLRVNDAFAALYGYAARADLEGKTSVELGLWTPEGRAEAIRELQERGNMRDLPVKARKADGTPTTILCDADFVDVDGERCILATSRAEGSPRGAEGIAFVSPKGAVSLWSRGAELLFGWNAEEAARRPFTETFSASERARVSKALADGRSAELARVIAADKSGRLFPVRVVLDAAPDADGRVLGFLALLSPGDSP